MDKKNVSHFSLAALMLMIVAALAALLSATTSYAADTPGNGCTSVARQGPSTERIACGVPAQLCTTVTDLVPQTSTDVVTPGYWYSCQRFDYLDGYWDYQYFPCYNTEERTCDWECDEWDCWQVCTYSPVQICPPPIEVWVEGRTYTYTGSCWEPPVYGSVTTWVEQRRDVCVPNCWTQIVPGQITYELVCPEPATPVPTEFPSSYNCAQKPKCQGNSVITWMFDAIYGPLPDYCVIASTSPCASGETCSSGICRRQISCGVWCLGDVAVTSYPDTFPSGDYYCRSSPADLVDCALQGKVCREGLGCFTRTTANDCTNLGCTSGYYCTLYPQEA